MKTGTIFYKIILLLLLIIQMGCTELNNHRDNNLTRVEVATKEKKSFLIEKLKSYDIKWNEVNLFIRAFKKEQVLEIWAKNNSDAIYQKVIEYDFCKLSGALGPKRKEGDLQVPEGIYKIDRFNAKSTFYLSLGINYPNKSDEIRGDQNKPGNDIFIHGACVTIGCIPITDDKIKELYVLAEQSKDNGQTEIQVNIFPTKLTKENLKALERNYPQEIDFWQELKVFYDDFEKTKQAPRFKTGTEGNYILM